jgi:hypothetical protein
MTTYFIGTATLLTPWSNVTLEKLMGAQPVTKYPNNINNQLDATITVY